MTIRCSEMSFKNNNGLLITLRVEVDSESGRISRESHVTVNGEVVPMDKMAENLESGDTFGIGYMFLKNFIKMNKVLDVLSDKNFAKAVGKLKELLDE